MQRSEGVPDGASNLTAGQTQPGSARQLPRSVGSSEAWRLGQVERKGDGMVATLRAFRWRIALAVLQALQAALVTRAPTAWPTVHAVAGGTPVREREYPFVAAFGKLRQLMHP